MNCRLLWIMSCILIVLLSSVACSSQESTYEFGAHQAELSIQLESSKTSLNSNPDNALQTMKQQPSDVKGDASKPKHQVQPTSNSLLQTKFPQTLVMRGSSESMKIAFTFDDGPDVRFTPMVLDILKKHDVKGTFFLLGSRSAELPEVTKRIQDEGHIIGNHTYWHPKLYQESMERLHWEIEETDAILEKITGSRPRLFRAPYGGLTEDIVRELGNLNYNVIGWSVDSEDWKGISAQEVKKHVLEQVHPGAIILMHSGGHWTQDLSGMTEALDELIPYFIEQGYELVTVPELLGYGEIENDVWIKDSSISETDTRRR